MFDNIINKMSNNQDLQAFKPLILDKLEKKIQNTLLIIVSYQIQKESNSKTFGWNLKFLIAQKQSKSSIRNKVSYAEILLHFIAKGCS